MCFPTTIYTRRKNKDFKGNEVYEPHYLKDSLYVVMTVGEIVKYHGHDLEVIDLVTYETGYIGEGMGDVVLWGVR
jgi:hypothetical protein